MAYFDTTSNGATGVEIAAAATGQVRFLCIGITNTSATAQTLTIYDGTKVAAVERVYMQLAANSTYYYRVDQSGQSVFPKNWWTSGSSIEFGLDGGTTGVKIWGELVREA